MFSSEYLFSFLRGVGGGETTEAKQYFFLKRNEYLIQGFNYRTVVFILILLCVQDSKAMCRTWVRSALMKTRVSLLLFCGEKSCPSEDVKIKFPEGTDFICLVTRQGCRLMEMTQNKSWKELNFQHVPVSSSKYRTIFFFSSFLLHPTSLYFPHNHKSVRSFCPLFLSCPWQYSRRYLHSRIIPVLLNALEIQAIKAYSVALKVFPQIHIFSLSCVLLSQNAWFSHTFWLMYLFLYGGHHGDVHSMNWKI